MSKSQYDGPFRWAVGVTTVPQRRNSLLPKTLASLENAGFDQLRLFVDGADAPAPWRNWQTSGITCRHPNVRTWGNWLLSLTELLIRNPEADRYAVFQDDLVASRNLRQYLDRCSYPEQGYWNLYTFPQNQALFPADPSGKVSQVTGWHPSNQLGRGAVGLVFNRAAVLALLGSPSLYERLLDPHRGWRAADGAVIIALKAKGWREFVHNPSPLQHQGHESTMDHGPHQQAMSFMGEGFDMLSLLRVSNPEASGDSGKPVESQTLPCPGVPEASIEGVGLGDLVHRSLAAVGITPRRVEEWLGKPCGCEERRQKLNRLGYWAKRIASGYLDRGSEYLERIMEGER